MAETKVIMPQMGESIFEGTITKWLKKQGERVERDEPLFEISTDKIDTEIPSPAAGVLQDILVKEGQTVQINTVVAVIGDGSAKPAEEKTKGTPKQEPTPKQETTPKETPKATTTEAPQEITGPAPVAGPTEQTRKEESQRGATASDEEVRSSPLVRRIAKEHNIDLASLAGKGTGIDGRITKSDILSYIEQPRKEQRPTVP